MKKCMNKKYQVFISSTYKDLKEERSGVISALLDLGCIPVGIEQFPAAPMKQWDYISMMIDESDYVVLIVAGKYGTEDKATGISYTEKEFLYAKERNKPILPFLIEDFSQIKLKTKVEGSESKITKLKSFRETIENSGYLVNNYKSIDDLRFKVARSMIKCMELFPAIGWIRADQIDND